MKNTKTAKALGLVLVLLGLAASARAAATNPARLNINITITQNLSVTVNGADTSTHTVAWNAANANDRLVSVASSTVLNDSGAQTERWQLSTNATSINTANNPETWAVSSDSSTVGADAFALQAVFGSSNTAAGGCPAFNAADWDQASAQELTATPATYTSSVFADASLNNLGGTPNPDVAGNGRMFAGSRRALCWRVITPATTSTSDTQNIQVTVTAIAP